MTLRHFTIFKAVYRDMSITRASQKLHLAQPGVSLAIREMEEYYGVPLFYRINRRIFPTEKGTQLYAYACQIADLFDTAEQAMRGSDLPAEIHLGSSVTIGVTLLPEVIRSMQEKYPSCKILVTVRNSQKIIQAVLKNELDFGLVEDRTGIDRLEEVTFCTDSFCFVCSTDHPLASRREVTLEEVCEYPLFLREIGSASRDVLDSLVKLHQLKYQIQWESASNQAILHALKSLSGVSVLPRRLVEEELECGELILIPLFPEAFQRNFSLIYHRRKAPWSALDALKEILGKI